MKRTGYQPDFLGDGISVPHPDISPRLQGVVYEHESLREKRFLDYIHYTVVMNKKTRQLLYVASNIDQNGYPKRKEDEHKRGHDKWFTDSRIPEDIQLDNDYYQGVENPYDRGHMVRRANNCWSPELANSVDQNRESNMSLAKREMEKANDDTFFYTNASLQHQYYNQDEWVGLEDIFKQWELDKNGRLCIFTGPVHRPFDRSFHRTYDDAARIPSAFFKIICYIGKDSNKLETRSFLLYQDEEMTNNYRGGNRYGQLTSTRYAKYQVSVTDIENLTGLEFDDALPSSNPIYFNTPKDPDAVARVYRYPERVPILVKQDLVNDILADRTTQEARDEDKVLKIIAALVNPVGRDSKKNEWITILNRSEKRVNLEGWELWNSEGKAIPLYGAINSGQTKRLSFGGQDFSLVNKDIQLVLRNPNKDTVDIASYTKAQTKKEGEIIVF